MRVLLLGGTVFLSRAVAEAALARGHAVTCVARGVSGAPPGGAEVVRADRAVPGSLEPLRGRGFDAVVDVATMSLPWVREALDVLGAWTARAALERETALGPDRERAAGLTPRDEALILGEG